jgi:hypothetical protein
MIYIGIDDTDIVDSPGTNQLARAIVAALGALAEGAIIVRHQLFVDPRVPYTSRNGSASIQLPRGDPLARTALIDLVRGVMRAWFVEGSDPGLCVAGASTREMAAFAKRTKTEVVTQAEARAVAARAGCHLEGLGGTEQGVVGALAAVPLAAGGNDGRVVHIHSWPFPDEFCGVRTVAQIEARGVDEIRVDDSGAAFEGDCVDVGKRLRPNWRNGRVVLLVTPPIAPGEPWRAIKAP